LLTNEQLKSRHPLLIQWKEFCLWYTHQYGDCVLLRHSLQALEVRLPGRVNPGLAKRKFGLRSHSLKALLSELQQMKRGGLTVRK
jgi:hypothetical protein